MSGQPAKCGELGCPLYGKGTGFVLGSGDPSTAKVALMLEAPGKDEVPWEVTESEEIERRQQAYPELSGKFIGRGMPVVGRSGGILWSWGMAAVQLTRKDVFVDNVLRCLPPKEGKDNYPKGKVRVKAEACCRYWDRWEKYKPTVSLVQIHPAAVAREPTPLPLMIKTFEKAKHFYLGGERPLVLCGGKASKLWLGHASNVTTFLGHYESETDFSHLNREQRKEAGMKVSTEKKVKVKKLTAKKALELLISTAQPVLCGEDGTDVKYKIETEISEEQYKQISALIAPKEKK
jgi:hypothetical protein